MTKPKNDNMKFWKKVCTPPLEVLTKITGGSLKGKTEINPQWRLKVMTEEFGQCGIGWKYEIDDTWIMNGNDNQVMIFAKVLLSTFIDMTEEDQKHGYWSDPIPGIGGAFLVEKYTDYVKSNDDAYKMAVTDALSVAFKALGIAADIYMGKNNVPTGSKHDNVVTQDDSTIPDNDTPSCPQCFKSEPVMLSRYEGPAYYCNNKKGGCGHKFDFFPKDEETPATVGGQTLPFLGDPKAEKRLDETTRQLEDSIEMETIPLLKVALDEMQDSQTMEDLTGVFNKNKSLHSNKDFMKEFKNIKANIDAESKQTL